MAAPPGAGAREADGAPASGQTGKPLPATDTEIFFDRNSTELTASDIKSLDAYAAAMAANDDPITAYGYASKDGDPVKNAQLADARAQVVRKYLIDKGIDAARITAEGHGFTIQFGEKDPPANRRVNLAPKPPAKSAQAGTPKTPISLHMRPGGTPADAPSAENPPLPKLSPADMEKILGPDKGVPRAQVEKELTDFLEKLMKSQGGKSVKITDKVRLAGNTLAKDLGDPEMQIDMMLRDDRLNYVPKELAARIARPLPDFIRARTSSSSSSSREGPRPPRNSPSPAPSPRSSPPAVRQATSWLPKTIQEFEWQFGVGALLTLAHDIAMTLGFFAFTRLQVDLNVVAAFLTIVGYSLNDTVVIYDRIREDLRKYRKMAILPLINLSLNETLARTVVTSITVLIALGDADADRAGGHLRPRHRDLPRRPHRDLFVDLHLGAGAGVARRQARQLREGRRKRSRTPLPDRRSSRAKLRTPNALLGLPQSRR